MIKRFVIGGLFFTMFFYLAGCGPSGSSLSGEELKRKYPEKRFVEIDGVTLHYEQEGLGKPIVLLHGFPMSTRYWRNLTPGLSYGNTIYNLDLMGFGLSEKPQALSYSLETYVTQLSKFVANFHLDNVTLIGHEDGAAIAALYTIRNPGKVRKLVLMNAPLVPAGVSFTRLLPRVPLIGGNFVGDWFMTRTLRGGMAAPTLMTDALVGEYLKPYQESPGARVALLKHLTEFDLSSFQEKEFVPNLPTVQTPTLVMWSDNDAYLPLEVGRKIHDLLPNDEFYVVLKSGHYSMEDRPEEVRQVIKEFLDKPIS
jgi:pimeloyl-ACP methyl ester carboxylesterase